MKNLFTTNLYQKEIWETKRNMKLDQIKKLREIQ